MDARTARIMTIENINNRNKTQELLKEVDTAISDAVSRGEFGVTLGVRDPQIVTVAGSFLVENGFIVTLTYDRYPESYNFHISW